MDSFSKFFTKHRHRGTGFTDTDSNYRRKHLNLVPDYVKTDASKNQKIEKLKNNKGTEVCFPKDLEYITKVFKIVPHKDKPRILGKTGIKLLYNPKTKQFILQK